VFLAGGEPFTNWVPAYGTPTLTRLRALPIGAGEKPYGIALTPVRADPRRQRALRTWPGDARLAP